jgi:hypothetical protein
MRAYFFRKRFMITLQATFAFLIWLSTVPTGELARAKTNETWLLPETVSAGFNFTCGIRWDGDPVCMSDNSYGQSATHPRL